MTSGSTTLDASGTTPPPVEAHATELARVLTIAKSHGKATDGGWLVNQKGCIEIIGARCGKVQQFEHVFVALHAKGRALEVVVVSSCYGDSRVTDPWLYTDVRPPRSVPEPPFVVAPDLSWLIYDETTLTAPGAWDVRLGRMDLATGARTTFADCVSPSLSPGEHWIACRTIDWSVYRVPIAGGKPALVHQGPGPSTWIPYAHVFPPPVSFPSSTTFAVEEGAGPITLAWIE